MWLSDPYRTRFLYTDYLDLGLAYNPGARRVLFVGLGGGSAPKRMWRDFPALRLQVVELDPDVVDGRAPVVCRAAGPAPRHRRERRQALAQGSRRALGCDRARRFLCRLDPVSPRDPRVPPARPDRLAPDGVVVVNIIGAVTGGVEALRSITKTYRSAFPTVVLHPVYDGPTDRRSRRQTERDPRGDGAGRAVRDGLAGHVAEVRAGARGAPDLSAACATAGNATSLRRRAVLTDDYARRTRCCSAERRGARARWRRRPRRSTPSPRRPPASALGWAFPTATPRPAHASIPASVSWSPNATTSPARSRARRRRGERRLLRTPAATTSTKASPVRVTDASAAPSERAWASTSSRSTPGSRASSFVIGSAAEHVGGGEASSGRGHQAASRCASYAGSLPNASSSSQPNAIPGMRSRSPRTMRCAIAASSVV